MKFIRTLKRTFDYLMIKCKNLVNKLLKNSKLYKNKYNFNNMIINIIS